MATAQVRESDGAPDTAGQPRFRTPRAAYVHVPFCRHRCGYCNFTLVAGRTDLIQAYLQALARELRGLDSTVSVETLFFGGGTPTHLEPARLEQLCRTVRERLSLSDGYEFSVEANPLDVTPEKLDVLAAAGATRLSLGAQSFTPHKLQVLERDHAGDDIERAVQRTREAGLTVALDLIFAAPGETVAAWQSDIESALCLRPDHLSIYGLTWERGTNFWGRRLRGELAGCDETAECIMYEWAIDRLLAAGYEHYEVSNFARPGHRCRHNEAYWMGRTYYAFGPGAARHVAGRREVNHRSTTTYIRRVLAGQSPVAESEFLTPAEAARERLVFGLRRLEGIAPDVFATETGFRLTDLAGPTLDRYCRSGWLEWQAGSLRLTRAGLLLSDALWPELLV